MNTIFANAVVGRKNIVFGIVLFLLLGVTVGIPLTIDFLGGSFFTPEQYQTWKVVHGYGVFLGFINYFFGLLIDQMELTKLHKETSAWAILIAGLFGGVTRSILILFSALSQYGLYASLGEVAFLSLGTFIFLRGLVNKQRQQSMNRSDRHLMVQSDSNLASGASSK